jgi:DNA (cytosine-5)-methyltransferase 1
LGTDFDCDGGLIAFGGNNTAGSIDIATAVNAHGGPHGRLDFESETFVTHSLRADGFDASEDGTGRGTPLVADTVRSHPRPGSNSIGSIAFGISSDALDRSGEGDGTAGERAGLGITIETQPALRARSNNSVAVAFAQNQRDELRCMDVAGALAAGGFENSSTTVALQRSAVRRLTPRECERLQGFPDDWTAITHRGKPAADGPRYRALGNAFAVPVVRWIARRLVLEDAAEASAAELAA